MTVPTFTQKSHVHVHSTDSPVTCQNCDHDYAGRFCSQCGQSAGTHRINWHYLWHEIPHSVWHVDKGILFTLKELFTRPGHTVREFLAGKRVRHYRPLALILVLGTVLAILLNVLDVSLIKETGKAMKGVGIGAQGSQRAQDFQATINAKIEKYNNLLVILLLPLSSLFSWWFFRKKGFSYPELLVANTFLANISMALSIVSVLLFKAFSGSAAAFLTVQTLTTLTGLGYTMWAYAQLYQGRVKPWRAALRAGGASIMSFISLSLIGGLIGIAYGAFIGIPKSEQAETQRTPPGVHAPVPKK